MSVVDCTWRRWFAVAQDHKLRSPTMAMKKKSTKKRAKKAAPARKRSVRKTAKKK